MTRFLALLMTLTIFQAVPGLALADTVGLTAYADVYQDRQDALEQQEQQKEAQSWHEQSAKRDARYLQLLAGFAKNHKDVSGAISCQTLDADEATAWGSSSYPISTQLSGSGITANLRYSSTERDHPLIWSCSLNLRDGLGCYSKPQGVSRPGNFQGVGFDITINCIDASLHETSFNLGKFW